MKAAGAWLKKNTWAAYVAAGALLSLVVLMFKRGGSNSHALEQLEKNAEWERGAARNEGRAQAWVERADEHVVTADAAKAEREALAAGLDKEVVQLDEMTAEQIAAMWNEGKIQK